MDIYQREKKEFLIKNLHPLFCFQISLEKRKKALNHKSNLKKFSPKEGKTSSNKRILGLKIFWTEKCLKIDQL